MARDGASALRQAQLPRIVSGIGVAIRHAKIGVPKVRTNLVFRQAGRCEASRALIRSSIDSRRARERIRVGRDRYVGLLRPGGVVEARRAQDVPSQIANVRYLKQYGCMQFALHSQAVLVS